MSSLRRIAAEWALVAVMAMGLAAPAEAGARRDDATAGAGGLDTALVAASARRLRPRDRGAEPGAVPDVGGQLAGHGPPGLFLPLWLGASSSLPPPAVVPARRLAQVLSRAPTGPLLASRTSRGPPSRS